MESEDAIESGTATSRRNALGLTAAIIGVTVAMHVGFLAADRRLPRDLGMFYLRIPDAWQALGDGPERASLILRTLLFSTGWYDLLIAGAMRIFGRSSNVFQSFDVLWVGLTMGLVAWLSWRLVGPRAAIIATALTGAMPGVVVAGRTAWLHLPEAALALLALACWQADPAMLRRRTGLGLGFVGALVIMLRPSGLVWTGTLALLPALTLLSAWLRGEGLPWRRISAVGLLWGLGLVVPVRVLGEYLSYKFDTRDRYASSLPAIFEQLTSAMGFLPGILVVVGALLGLVVWLRRRPAAAPGERAVGAILTLWIVVPATLWLIFQAGIDNFTLLGPALAIAAAWGLVATLPRVGIGLSLLAYLIFTLPQLAPPPALDSWLMRLPDAPIFGSPPTVMNFYRPYDGFGEAEVGALIDTACAKDAPDGSCVIAVDQGLAYPFAEEPGQLELFILGEARVKLMPLRHQSDIENNKIAALAEYHCGDRDLAWRERYPRSLSLMISVKERAKLEPIWSFEVAPRCALVWFVPDGEALAPEALPARGRREGVGMGPGGAPPANAGAVQQGAPR